MSNSKCTENKQISQLAKNMLKNRIKKKLRHATCCSVAPGQNSGALIIFN